MNLDGIAMWVGYATMGAGVTVFSVSMLWLGLDLIWQQLSRTAWLVRVVYRGLREEQKDRKSGEPA